MDIVYSSSAFEGIEVLSCSGDHSFAKHLHDGYVLWLNSESGENYSLKGNSDILQPGTIGIIEPGVIHTNSPCIQNRRHLRSFYFSADFLSRLFAEISDGKEGQSLLQTCVVEDKLLWHKFIELHDILFHSENHLGVESAVLSTFAHLASRSGVGTIDSKLSPLHGGHTSCPEPRIKTVIEFFHDNIDRQFSLDDLAALIGCSKYHLIRLFRLQQGMSPHAYLNQLRLEHARRLLESGSEIAEAALASGFSDQSHLTRKFKHRYGLPPGQYQVQRLS